jgi:hypothetical protein
MAAKYCIFICVFNNEKYLLLLELLLDSILLYGNLSDKIDIVVYTSTHLSHKIKEFGYDIKTAINDNYNSVYDACKARLDVFDIPLLSTYKKILYLDTDIIIKGDLNKLFELDTRDILYALEEGDIFNDNWGGILFANDIGDFCDKEDLSGFTTGILLFNYCDSMRFLFSQIKQDIMNRPVILSCFDQPFIVYNAFRYNLYDNKVLKAFAVNNNRDANSDKIIHHFPGWAGIYENKIEPMMTFMNALIRR